MRVRESPPPVLCPYLVITPSSIDEDEGDQRKENKDQREEEEFMRSSPYQQCDEGNCGYNSGHIDPPQLIGGIEAVEEEPDFMDDECPDSSGGGHLRSRIRDPHGI